MLERQGRNKFINLATQIGHVGTNLVFAFFKNQVRRLMNESPYDERNLEVLQGILCRSIARDDEFILRSHEKDDYNSTN